MGQTQKQRAALARARQCKSGNSVASLVEKWRPFKRQRTQRKPIPNIAWEPREQRRLGQNGVPAPRPSRNRRAASQQQQPQQQQHIQQQQPLQEQQQQLQQQQQQQQLLLDAADTFHARAEDVRPPEGPTPSTNATGSGNASGATQRVRTEEEVLLPAGGDRVSRSQADMQDLQRQAREASGQRDQLQAAVASLQAQHSHLQGQHGHLQASLHALQAERLQQQQEQEAQQAQRAQQQAEADRQLLETEQARTRAHVSVEELLATCSQLQIKLQELQAEHVQQQQEQETQQQGKLLEQNQQQQQQQQQVAEPQGVEGQLKKQTMAEQGNSGHAEDRMLYIPDEEGDLDFSREDQEVVFNAVKNNPDLQAALAKMFLVIQEHLKAQKAQEAQDSPEDLDCIDSLLLLSRARVAAAAEGIPAGSKRGDRDRR